MARIFLSYAHSDGASAAEQLATELSVRHDVWMDRERLRGGTSWSDTIEQELDSRDIVLALLSHGSHTSIVCRGEHLRASRKGKRVIPILLQADADLPVYLEGLHRLDYRPGTCNEIYQAIEHTGHEAKLKPEYRITDYQTVPRLPNELVDRPAELDRLRKLLISDFGTRRVAVVAMRAMGGIGKTVLAQMAGYDRAVQDAFPDGVIWCTIGENPTEAWLIEQLREAGKRLGDRMDRYDSLTGCRNQLNTVLRDKCALLILDDVWHAPHANHFLADSPTSRVLVTTRETHVATALSAKDLSLNPMSDHESRELLAAWAGASQESLPPEADEVRLRCGRLPLALAMCGAMVRDGHTWATVAADLGRVEHEFAGYPHKELFTAISASVEKLGEPLRTRYTDLAVFPTDVPIPVSVLGALWTATKQETERTLIRLTGASLCSREGSTLALHDVQHAWCAAQLEKTASLRGLEIIQDAIRLSSHVLARGTNALPGQLIGRLRGEDSESIQRLLNRLRSSQAGAWIEPLTGSLTPPGGPLVRTLAGHSGAVWAVAVTRNGRCAVSASIDGTLKVWDLATGLELLTLLGHSDAVTAVAVIPNGNCAISASKDRTLKVWNLTTGLELLTLQGHSGAVWAVAVTQDGKRAVSGSADKTLKIWDLDSGRELLTLEGHSAWVNAVALTPDGQRAVSASLDKTVKVWDLASGRVCQSHSDSVNAVTVSPDGTRVVSASDDRTLKVRHLDSGRELLTLTGHASAVKTVAVTPDSRRAISAALEQTLKLWDLASGRELLTLPGHSHFVNGIEVTPDGKRALSASDDQTIKVWNLSSVPEFRTVQGHSGWVNAVAVTPDGKRAVSAASEDQALKVWDLTSCRELLTLQGHSGRVNAVAVTPDGKRIISASVDKTLKVWDLDSGRELLTLAGHSSPVKTVAVTPDSRRVISAALEQTLKLWDLDSGRELLALGVYDSWVNAIAVTPDGACAVSASESGPLHVWDLASGRQLRVLQGHSNSVAAVAMTPDSQRAVSASSDGTLRVWDLASGCELLTLRGHAGSVRAVATTHDGQHVISVSNDQTVRVWDLASAAVLTQFNADAPLYAVAVATTPDRHTIVAGDALGRLHFLRLHGL